MGRRHREQLQEKIRSRTARSGVLCFRCQKHTPLKKATPVGRQKLLLCGPCAKEVKEIQK